jgi:hypothetical protein
MTSTRTLASLTELDALTQSILDRGIDADCSGLVALARAARSAGLSETLIGITLDPAEPSAARERAFANLARGLTRTSGAWTTVRSQQSRLLAVEDAATVREGLPATTLR